MPHRSARPFFLTVILVLTGTATSVLADGMPDSTSIEDFRALEGGPWSGTLTYLNYSSDDRFSIPVRASFDTSQENRLVYDIEFPEEPQHNSTSTLSWSSDGLAIEGHALFAREVADDGTVTLTTEGRGEDNGREADIRTTYIISANRFIMRKHVRYLGDSEFFNRNTFELTR